MAVRFPDPLRPLSDVQLRQRARADVIASTRPLAAAIAQAARAGQINILGVSNDLANRLGDYRGAEQGIYDRANQALSSFNQQAADRLAGSSGLADQLRARLQNAGQDTGLADKLAATAGAASGAGFVRGGAETNALTQRQAAAEDYAAKLPGLARLSALQALSQRQAQQQSDTANLQAKAASTLASDIQHARDVEFQKASLAAGLGKDYAAIDAQNQRAAADRRAANNRNSANNAARSAVQAQRDKAAAARQAAHDQAAYNRTQAQIRAAAQRTGRTYDPNLSRDARHAVDHQGRPIINPATGQPYPYKEPPKSKGGKKSSGGYPSAH